MPLPLEYHSQTPPAVSPARARAAREAIWNGIPDILIGATCAGTCVWTLNASFEPNMFFLWTMVAAYGVFFLACGLLYTIGSSRIKNGSASWHRALIIAACVQIAAVLAWYPCLRLNSMQVQWAIFASILFGGLIVAGQLRMIWGLGKSWKEIKTIG